MARSCQDGVYQWTETVWRQLPHLSKPQATVLALWSLGMVLSRSCALSAVSLMLAVGLGRQENSVRQQLREWCYEAAAKREAELRAELGRLSAPVLRVPAFEEDIHDLPGLARLGECLFA